MAGSLHFDESQWPIVVITAPVQWGAETVARYTEETARYVAAGSAFALILDLSRSALLPTDARSKLTAHRRWLFEHTGSPLVSEVVVVRSRPAREFFSVPCEGPGPVQRFCVGREQAVARSVEVIRRLGVGVESVPPRHSGVAFRPLRKATLPPLDYLSNDVALELRRASGKR
jgi:hypothetical protein